MIKVESPEQDLRFSAGEDELQMAAATEENLTGFEAMVEDNQIVEMGSINEKDLWPDDDDDDVNQIQNQDTLLDEASIFYNDFPPLPDFPCMSSSSSSSPSTPAATKPPPSSGSSSPSASWPAMNSESSSQQQFKSLSSTASMEIPAATPAPAIDDVMENLQYIDLIDCNEMWDPSTIFHSDSAAAAQPPPPPSQDGLAGLLEGNIELSLMFFDWLKQNKELISAEDMRSIKLRKSTIDSATRRLGTTQDGQKMLLKLILDWVQLHYLKKKRGAAATAAIQNPNPNFIYNPSSPDPNACFSPWMPPPPPPPTPQTPMYPMGGGGGYDPYSPYPYSTTLYPNSGEHQGVEHQTWGMMMPMVQPQFNHYPDNHRQAVYGSPYPKMVRLGPSATKEARRKRMDHQRRVHHHHPYRHSSNQHNRNQTTADNVVPLARGVVAGDCVGDQNVKLWSDGDGGEVAAEKQATAAASDRRQQQVEQNLKLLLQKVLKQSDVGNLGRIVLPKKEAETHLPELDTRDGITIPMEDIGTSRVWNMRYRFWPNNKSRMYLLENTGDFVRVNGLQEGDFIVLYSDTKCGKYMIRGVKVPDPGTKPEGKKATKRNGRNLPLAGINSSSPVPIKKAAS